jgi:YbbR domain-containing protein
MARRLNTLRPGALLLALIVAVILWGIAHGVSSVERMYDVPIELSSMSEDLVVTDQAPKHVNVRIMGSQAALRNVDASRLHYLLDVEGSKPGDADFEIDVSNIALPRGARIVSRSPSRILLRFEPRGRKSVGVRADISGEPAQGFELDKVEILPNRVWLTGARSQVLRLNEVMTEPISLTGLRTDTEREVSVILGAGTVRLENFEPVKIVIHIVPKGIAVPTELEADYEPLEKS